MVVRYSMFHGEAEFDASALVGDRELIRLVLVHVGASMGE